MGETIDRMWRSPSSQERAATTISHGLQRGQAQQGRSAQAHKAHRKPQQELDYVFKRDLWKLARWSVIGVMGAGAGGWALIFSLTNNSVVAASMVVIPISWTLTLIYIANETAIKKFWLLTRGELAKAALLPSECVRRATIVDNLQDKLEHVLADGGTLIVTGGDCYPICADDYRWKQELRNFLGQGCHVIQYAVEPTTEADAVFAGLDNEHKQFTYRKMPSPSKWVELDAEAQALLNWLRRCHPTLAASTDGRLKMVWLEQDHPPRTTRAYNCQYWSPADIQAVPKIYDDMRNLLDSAWTAARAGNKADTTQSRDAAH